MHACECCPGCALQLFLLEVSKQKACMNCVQYWLLALYEIYTCLLLRKFLPTCNMCILQMKCNQFCITAYSSYMSCLGLPTKYIVAVHSQDSIHTCKPRGALQLHVYTMCKYAIYMYIHVHVHVQSCIYML